MAKYFWNRFALVVSHLYAPIVAADFKNITGAYYSILQEYSICNERLAPYRLCIWSLHRLPLITIALFSIWQLVVARDMTWTILWFSARHRLSGVLPMPVSTSVRYIVNKTHICWWSSNLYVYVAQPHFSLSFNAVLTFVTGLLCKIECSHACSCVCRWLTWLLSVVRVVKLHCSLVSDCFIT